MTVMYTPLAEITLGSTDTDVIFANIPNTFRDLLIVGSARSGTGTTSGVRLQVNSDASNIYSVVAMGGEGTTIYSAVETYTAAQPLYWDTIHPTDPNAMIFQFLDYAVTDKHKTFLYRGGRAGYFTVASANRWGSTAAISSINVYSYNGSFASGSTFVLYGVK